MEALVELVPLLLVAGYYLLAARRRAAKQRAMRERAQDVPDAAPGVARETRGPTPFQDFMEQLEEAMAEAAGEPVPEPPKPDPTPEPVKATIPPPRPTPSPQTTEFRPVSGSFSAPRPVDHEAHGFGAENPLSEESFERLPAFGPRPRATKKAYDPHGLRAAPADPKPRHLGNLKQRLQTSEAAREAFVLQTIFGPRGGRRAENR